MEANELRVINIEENEKYFITQDGNVYSQRKNLNKLKHELRNGYPSVTLSIKYKKPIKYLVHRLVAITFISNPENKPCVNHKDGIKTNNNVDNLEWCTYSENERHSHYVLGKVIKHSEETKNKIRKATMRHKSYLDNFKCTQR